MKYSRYGKIRFKNHWINYLMYLGCLVVAILGITTEGPKIGVAFCIGIAIFDMIDISTPYREKFLFNQDTITVYKKRKIRNINLPLKVIVVISYASMYTEFSRRMAVHVDYMLKGEWAVSLLKDVSVEEVTKRLHRKGAFLYTNYCVEDVLKQHFIYSFVCNQSMLEEVLNNRNFTLIIPETLLPMIDIIKLNGEIYIDEGF